MTQQEFETRVQVKVSTQEYWHINEMYNNSDLDKVEFCKLWVKMNQGRVNKAKEAAKKEAEKEAKLETLWNIVMKYGSIATCSNEMHTTLAVAVLTDKERSNLESLGFDMKEDWCIGSSDIRPFKRMSTILYEIDKYLKTA